MILYTFPQTYRATDYSSLWKNRVSAPDMGIDALGYNGVTPGPLIVMKQGEWIYLTVENRMEEPTALHIHGLSKPNSQDGVPEITPATPTINPGEAYTYKFFVDKPVHSFITRLMPFRYHWD